MGKTLLATLKEKEQYLGDFLDTNFKMAKVVNGFSTKQSFVYKQDIHYQYTQCAKNSKTSNKTSYF